MKLKDYKKLKEEIVKKYIKDFDNNKNIIMKNVTDEIEKLTKKEDDIIDE